MDILLLIKDLITNIEIIGMFIFAFIFLFVIFRDVQAISKCLRKVVILYIILKAVMKLLLA